MPEPPSKTSAPTDSSDASGMPPVSGNTFDGAAEALLVVLGADALADGLADEVADGLAVVLAVALAVAPDIAVAEASEAGLVIMLLSILMLPIPPEFIPWLPPPW
jgi:hypothetical protein